MLSAKLRTSSYYLLWLPLAALLLSGPSLAQEPARPAEPYAQLARDAELEKKTTAELIDALEKMKHPTLNVWSSTGREFPFPEPGERSQDEKPVYPPFAELTRRGLEAVPELLKHLDDKRLTQLEEIVESTSHEATVGDLCYCALGQILNEDYHLVRVETFGPLAHAEVKSPTADPKLAKSVRDKWRNFTATEHEQLLMKAAQRTDPYVDHMAFRRLCVYYPQTAEKVAVRLLNRPLYDKSKLWKLIASDLENADPADWKGMIDSYVRDNGEVVRPIIPFWINWIFFETSQDWKPGQKDKVTRFMKEVYPNFERHAPVHLAVEGVQEQASVVRTLRFFKSSRADAAVHALFLRAKDFKFARNLYPSDSTGDNFYFDRFVEVCFERLQTTKHGDDYRTFFLAKVAALERQAPQNWREIDAWHKLATGKRKSASPTAEQRQGAVALRALDLSVDGWIEGEIEYGDQVHFSPGDEKKPFPVAAFPHIAKLSELRELWLGGPEVTDTGMAQLAGLGKLEDVRLENTRITGAALSYLTGSKGLRQLDVSQSRVDDAGLVHLAKFEWLEDLSLARTRVTGQGLAHLRVLKHLKKLNLTGCRKIADGDLASLAELTELTRLTLDVPEVGDEGLPYLNKLAKLEELSLLHCRATPRGLNTLRKNFPKTAISYFWDFRLKQTPAGVLVTMPQVTVLLEQATLPIDDGALDTPGIDQEDEPRIRLTKDGFSGSLGGSTHMLMSGDLSVNIASGSDGADILLECPQRDAPKVQLKYHLVFTENCGTLQCGDQTFDLQTPKRITVDTSGKAKEVSQ